MTTDPSPVRSAPVRRRVTVRGVVQGVGFRPFVYGLACELRLVGDVTNTGEGVVAEVEGAAPDVAAFCERIGAQAPPLAVVQSVRHEPLAPRGGRGFTIAPSRPGGARRTLVAPDTATCADCLAELCDPADRRYRHPFITCTHCGPRFTIVTGLPYDRGNTTMAGFPMCPACAREYADPADRRFHAQPVACHDCGPRLWWDVPGRTTADDGTDPIAGARELLADGAVLAVKGLGGYHLACDAANADAVGELRRRKARGDKPFAVMAADLADVSALADLDPAERALLTGRRRPIVLLRRRRGAIGGPVADAVAPGSADLGVMLPYTPLHHLLLGLPGDPPGPRLLVMTSGNRGGEPIVTDDREARDRLAGLADAWLGHDRTIHVPCDDSVVRICEGEELPMRRSRGYAPMPLPLPCPVTPALAVGGDLKNTFCLGRDRTAWLSAHVGDMDDVATLTAFARAERQLETIADVAPRLLVTDRHPGYRSGRWAQRNAGGRPVRQVQHHHAHIAAVMADHGLDGTRPVIGVAFDGTGYGDDGAVWGGEFLIADYDGYRRAAHLGYVPLPGGDAAVRRPYRMALAHLWAAGLPWASAPASAAACPDDERGVLERQLARGLNCVPTSSMGRLFDAMASLTGVCQQARYEAQAAVELEAAAWRAGDPGGAYAFRLRPVDDGAEPGLPGGGCGDRPGAGPPPAGADGPLVLDPAPVLAAALADLSAGVSAQVVAARFHAGLALAVRRTCAVLRDRTGLDTVGLSGGVFANALLASACCRGLREDGFTVLRHRTVPPNDGGLALGQLVIAARAVTGGSGPPAGSDN
jgi:hydrogenase maturation protein HypF